MAGRQCQHRVVARCENRSSCSHVGRHAGDARSAWSSSALQLSGKSPVSARRQRCQTVAGLEGSLLRAALRTPGLRSVSKSRELQRELVRKAHGKRLNQSCHSRVLPVFDDTTVDEVAPTKRDPAAPCRMTSLNDAAVVLGALSLCAHKLRHSFSRQDFRTLRCFLNRRCCANR